MAIFNLPASKAGDIAELIGRTNLGNQQILQEIFNRNSANLEGIANRQQQERELSVQQSLANQQAELVRRQLNQQLLGTLLQQLNIQQELGLRKDIVNAEITGEPIGGPPSRFREKFASVAQKAVTDPSSAFIDLANVASNPKEFEAGLKALESIAGLQQSKANIAAIQANTAAITQRTAIEKEAAPVELETKKAERDRAIAEANTIVKRLQLGIESAQTKLEADRVALARAKYEYNNIPDDKLLEREEAAARIRQINQSIVASENAVRLGNLQLELENKRFNIQAKAQDLEEFKVNTQLNLDLLQLYQDRELAHERIIAETNKIPQEIVSYYETNDGKDAQGNEIVPNAYLASARRVGGNAAIMKAAEDKLIAKLQTDLDDTDKKIDTIAPDIVTNIPLISDPKVRAKIGQQFTDKYLASYSDIISPPNAFGIDVDSNKGKQILGQLDRLNKLRAVAGFPPIDPKIETIDLYGIIRQVYMGAYDYTLE